MKTSARQIAFAIVCAKRYGDCAAGDMEPERIQNTMEFDQFKFVSSKTCTPWPPQQQFPNDFQAMLSISECSQDCSHSNIIFAQRFSENNLRAQLGVFVLRDTINITFGAPMQSRDERAEVSTLSEESPIIYY